MPATHISEAKNWKGTRVTKWTVILPEVLDTPEGFDVNDVRSIGKIELANFEDDNAVIEDLKSNEYLHPSTTLSDFVIDGDEDILYINRLQDGRPLLHIQRIFD